MNDFKTLFLVLCFSGWAAVCLADKPNIVIFFIDDLGYKDLGCYGSEFYETPRIDALASSSVRFTQFYSAHPVCSPTRAALMTGKAPQRLGITQWIPQPSKVHLPAEEVSLGEAFQEAGYNTGYIGKWHLGSSDSQMPDQNGFDWCRAVNRAGQPASYFHPFTGREKDDIAYWDVPDMEGSQPGDYLTDGLTDHAIDFITLNRDKPFLLCLSHYAVHTPIQSPKALVKKYREKKMNVSDVDNEVDWEEEINDARTRIRQNDPSYGAMVENLDFNVGRVMDKLDDLGIRDNTIVVFTSDNGGLSTLRNRLGPTSVKPLRAGKGWCYEGGIRVPTMVSWSKTLQSGESSVPAITMDIYPTLLELAGLEPRPEQTLDGVSLVQALNRDSDSPFSTDRVLGWHYPHHHGGGHTPSSAIRDGQWKLIWKSDTDMYELYDLTNDVGESKNLVERNPKVALELKEKLAGWLDFTSQSESPSGPSGRE